MIEELVGKIYKPHEEGITLVGITGFQGAGKSTLITNLRDYVQGQGIGFETISSDLYHQFTRAEKREIFERGKRDGMNLVDIMLQAYQHNTALMRSHFSTVKKGANVRESGLYENTSGEKTALLNLDLTKRPTLVVAEGVYILQDGAGDLLDEVVFVDATKEERLRRTIERQSKRPGAHKIDLNAFEAMEAANQQWICPHLKKPYISVENTDFLNPVIRMIQ